MLEQFQGVGITSLATHADGVSPRALATQNGQTTWEAVLNFPDLPLHSGLLK
jgi:lipopolysaccharide transport system ATP-binding protein